MFVGRRNSIGDNKMRMDSMIVEGSEEEKYIMNMCENRWKTKKQPCRGCKYRYPLPENKLRCCIFPTTPNLWGMYREK